MSAAHHLQPVLTALVVSGGIAYVLDYFQAHAKVLGGTKKEDMPTWDGKWKEAERERFMGNMNREACPDSPVFMNPIRHGIPGQWRNKEDIPSLNA